MKEILDNPDHQENHRNTQADNGENAEESKRIIVSIPEDGGQSSELLHNPVTDSGKDSKNCSQQRICQCKHLTKNN